MCLSFEILAKLMLHLVRRLAAGTAGNRARRLHDQFGNMQGSSLAAVDKR